MNGPVKRFEPRQPLFLVPWPVVVLIGLLCTAYAAYSLAPVTLQQQLIVHYALIPAVYAGGAYGVHLRGLWLVVPHQTGHLAPESHKACARPLAAAR